MKKVALLATAALMASAGTYAFAQGAGQGAPGQGGSGNGPRAAQAERGPNMRGMSQEDYNRLVDARVAALKAGLKLNADQEKLWGPVETEIRSAAADRYKRFEQRDTMRENARNMDAMQRLEMRSAMMSEMAQHLSNLSKAMRPLWDSFNEDQKRIAPRLLQQATGSGMMGGRERGGRHHRGEHGRMGGHPMMERHGMGEPLKQL